MMGCRILRITLGLLTGFITLTAMGGGIALFIGLEDERFPLEWLAGTPFSDYTIPALLLAIVVGGSALVACVTTFMGHGLDTIAAVLAGAILMGYVVVEVLLLKQVPPGPTSTEYLYFALGLMVFVLAGYIGWAQRRVNWQQSY